MVADVSGPQPALRRHFLTPDYGTVIGWRDASTVLVHAFTDTSANTSAFYWVDVNSGVSQTITSYAPNFTGASMLVDAARDLIPRWQVGPQPIGHVATRPGELNSYGEWSGRVGRCDALGLSGGRMVGVVTHPLWRPYLPRANADRQSQRVARRQVHPGPLQPYREQWGADYDQLRQLISGALHDRALSIDHVGSTAVPGLTAKPVIDIDLTVRDVEDESTYLPELEQVGWVLIFRDDLGGEAHRQLTFAAPNANLHVWGPGAIEPQRHRLFTRWLADHPVDLDLYAAAKLRAVDARGGGRYNDLKAAVVYDIYERAFLADPAYEHDPQPR